MRKAMVCTMALAVALGCMAAQADEWESLFDGKTLEGWTQRNGTANYTVEDGTIVGETAQGSPNSFLCTDKHYGDFELEFEVMCDEGLNSGVQIRSLQKGKEDESPTQKSDHDARVYGPQVEIENSPGESGYIYGEATGHGWLSKDPSDPSKNSPPTHSTYKNGEWNEYRVVAQGPRIQTYINGEQIEDMTHEEIYEDFPEGFIGLQVHGIGEDQGPFQVAWRNLRIRTLD